MNPLKERGHADGQWRAAVNLFFPGILAQDARLDLMG
jgi:hypothetical protein